MKTLTLILLACVSLYIVPAPQGFAKPKDESSEAENEKKKKKIKKLTQTLAHSQDQVHSATLEALARIGCNIKEDTGTTVEGKRPNKIGALVGSGGEILKVNLVSKGENKTEITVETKKTMVGMAGQKLWTEELMEQIKSILAE